MRNTDTNLRKKDASEEAKSSDVSQRDLFVQQNNIQIYESKLDDSESDIDIDHTPTEPKRKSSKLSTFKSSSEERSESVRSIGKEKPKINTKVGKFDKSGNNMHLSPDPVHTKKNSKGRSYGMKGIRKQDSKKLGVELKQVSEMESDAEMTSQDHHSRKCISPLKFNSVETSPKEKYPIASPKIIKLNDNDCEKIKNQIVSEIFRKIKLENIKIEDLTPYEEMIQYKIHRMATGLHHNKPVVKNDEAINGWKKDETYKDPNVVTKRSNGGGPMNRFFKNK